MLRVIENVKGCQRDPMPRQRDQHLQKHRRHHAVSNDKWGEVRQKEVSRQKVKVTEHLRF